MIFWHLHIRQNQFNLLNYWCDRPYFTKSKKKKNNFTKFWRISFFNFFTLCFYSIICWFQPELRMIYLCQKQPLELLCAKARSDISFEISQKNLCWSHFLITFQAYRSFVWTLLCFSCCWVFLYQQNRFAYFLCFHIIDWNCWQITHIFFLCFR